MAHSLQNMVADIVIELTRISLYLFILLCQATPLVGHPLLNSGHVNLCEALKDEHIQVHLELEGHLAIYLSCGCVACC